MHMTITLNYRTIIKSNYCNLFECAKDSTCIFLENHAKSNSTE